MGGRGQQENCLSVSKIWRPLFGGGRMFFGLSDLLSHPQYWSEPFKGGLLFIYQNVLPTEAESLVSVNGTSEVWLFKG